VVHEGKRRKKIVAFDLSFSFISRHYNFFSRSTFRQQFLDSFFVNFRETNRVTKIYENSLTVKRDPLCDADLNGNSFFYVSEMDYEYVI